MKSHKTGKTSDGATGSVCLPKRSAKSKKKTRKIRGRESGSQMPAFDELGILYANRAIKTSVVRVGRVEKESEH